MFRFARSISNTLKRFRRQYSFFGCDSSAPVGPCTKITGLPNGMRVATEVTDSFMVCVSLFVEVGPVYETPLNHGITHFIEHMAYRGFKSIGKQELEDYVEDIGAKLTVSTTREFQVFSAQCLAVNVCHILGIFSRIVTELELSQSEIDMAKCTIDIESYDADNNSKLVVSDYLHETAFQGTPYSRRVMGPSKNIKKFDKNTVECFMKEFYYPARFVLATSGAISHEEIVNNAQACFGNIAPPCGTNFCPPQRYTGSQITYRDDTMPLVHAALAVEAPGYKNANEYLMMLLASNMIGSWSKSQGGSNRHGSPLARAAATSNLCDSFESFYVAYRDVGLWGIYMIAEKMDIEDLISNVQDRWMNLCTTTLFNDVERGINATKLELAKKMEGSTKSCYDIGIQMLYNCDRRNLSEMYGALSRANEKVIRKVAGQYLYDKCPVVSAIGPVEALPDYTRTRAGMYWLRL